MTKRKFYTIKTLVAIGLSVFIYFCIDLFFKNLITDGRKPSELELGTLFHSALVVFIIFIIRLSMYLWSTMVDFYCISICKCSCRYFRWL